MSPSSSEPTQTENSPKKKGKSLPASFIIKFGKFVWTTQWKIMMSKLAPKNSLGAYVRPASQFRNVIGTEKNNPYPPASGRYRLYVGLGCPWAHRTLVVRTLKGLEDVISISVVSPSGDEGIWVFDTPEENCRTLPELYQLAKPGYSGRSTVPVLWDSQTKTIVNNESAEIIVILNSQFNEFAKNPHLDRGTPVTAGTVVLRRCNGDLYPQELKQQIDRWNEKIYTTVNNGVYRCGFAQTQAAYEEACTELFSTLDEIDRVLATNRYLCGNTVTLADVRLFTTLFRFDIVYYSLFKCNRRRIQDYSNLGAYLRDLYQLPGVANTCDLESVKQDYYGNLFPLNPGGIIPLGPDVDNLLEPHDRARISQ